MRNHESEGMRDCIEGFPGASLKGEKGLGQDNGSCYNRGAMAEGSLMKDFLIIKPGYLEIYVPWE